MCTVSFVRSGTSIIITSNRDEQVERASNRPEKYSINGKQILFPKDPIANGTWYAVDEFGNVVVLLNGAFGQHQRKLPYRRSRGLIVLDIISAASPDTEWRNIELQNIEPFTLVVLENNRLYQMRWNGFEKDACQLDSGANHIWSSPMLYSKETIHARETSFLNFINSRIDLSKSELIEFHSAPEKANAAFGLVIERDFLRTISITQTVINSGEISMYHKDLVHGDEFTISFIR